MSPTFYIDEPLQHGDAPLLSSHVMPLGMNLLEQHDIKLQSQPDLHQGRQVGPKAPHVVGGQAHGPATPPCLLLTGGHYAPRAPLGPSPTSMSATRPASLPATLALSG